MTNRRAICLVLGGMLWALAGAGVIGSVQSVRSRVNRASRVLLLNLSQDLIVRPGDAVFLALPDGLKRAGEVTAVHSGASGTTLAVLSVDPEIGSMLNASARAAVWQAPLSAQAALESLLPADLLRRASDRINDDWRSHETDIAAMWSPVLLDIGKAYTSLMVEEFRAAIVRHEERLGAIAREQGEKLARRWPTIQQRLTPILERHVTPIISKLLAGAMTEAPKLDIALMVAKMDFSGAFQRMLDAMAQYLASMPEHEQAAVELAFRRAWDEARSDPVLSQQFSEWGRGVLEDEPLKHVLSEIYDEAFRDNQRIESFIRKQLLESESVRSRLYETIEIFGPTARDVLALSAFDEGGTTRPEVVHLLRSVALRRNIAWVTLEVTDLDAEPLPTEAVLTAVDGDPFQ